MIVDQDLAPADLTDGINRLTDVSRDSVSALRTRWERAWGAPVFTIDGRYTSRGWTEWTQGFQFGLPLLLFELTGDESMLEYGRRQTVEIMAPHLTHTGVHDHGFNNVSTYGALLRMMREGAVPADQWQRRFYELALKVSGAVQASRWTSLPDGLGFVCSFNGAHSLFADTVRSLRSLACSHVLGHQLLGEQDRKINLLGRLLAHAETTARFNVYFGDGRDSYDTRGRVAHESIFNLESGAYRCPSSQQGYSPFSTWTRGQAWILLGYPEQIEFIETLTDDEIRAAGSPVFSDRDTVLRRFVEVARAVADHYMDNSPADGVPYWDTGAPGLARIGDYRRQPADPFNQFEPVDSSAAAIAAQGLLRLGDYLSRTGETGHGERYTRAGLTVARALLSDRYLSAPGHEGILLHSVYHRPNGWDHVPEGRSVPCGESCLWGDYHLVELALCLKRLAEGRQMQRFFDIGGHPDE